ncbi:ABC transporter substrate-binding protein [Ferviditalea candida]|uniref:Sugar ABC transporter substrate-binding protein n=1 Tax=Ferviditalea candida TaxID=3108399 RepID=A0ABU5ZEP5_9BACL|nr:sugar ABC transporter substrate-binding protein [Paenibacillaceae bacterium T2]
MKTRVWIARVMILVLVVGLLGGCGQKRAEDKPAADSGQKQQDAPKPVEFTVWWMENRDDPVKAITKVIDDFQKENSNIKIKLESFSWEDVKPKVLAAINAGRAPDVIQSIPDFTVAIKETGAIQPVDDIVKEINDKFKFYQSQLDPYYYDNHYWAIPIFGMDVNLYYRKDILKKANIEPPKNWDELLAAAKQLNSGTMAGLGMPTSNSMYTDQILYNFMITNGGDLYDDKGNITFDTPENVAALKIMKDLAPYTPVDANTWWWQQAVENFVGGKSAMVLLLGLPPSFWYANQKDMRDQLGVVPFPVGPKGTPGSTSYSNGFMVTTTDSAKKEAIEKFLVYLHDPDRNGKFLADMLPGMYLPVTEASGKSDGFNKQEVISFYKDVVQTEIQSNEHGKLFGFTHGTPPKSIGPIAASNVLGKIVNKMIVEKMSPEDAAKWGQQELERVAKQ